MSGLVKITEVRGLPKDYRVPIGSLAFVLPIGEWDRKMGGHYSELVKSIGPEDAKAFLPISWITEVDAPDGFYAEFRFEPVFSGSAVMS